MWLLLICQKSRYLDIVELKNITIKHIEIELRNFTNVPSFKTKTPPNLTFDILFILSTLLENNYLFTLPTTLPHCTVVHRNWTIDPQIFQRKSVFLPINAMSICQSTLFLLF
jgi:hypothetical protein